MKANCCNCGGDSVVTVSVPCPTCKGNGLLEIDELRKLYIYVYRNFVPDAFEPKKRFPSKKLMDLLVNIQKSRGEI